VRWTHPAAYNRRTATRDLELFGELVHAGDKVVFWEASANRDEDVFVGEIELTGPVEWTRSNKHTGIRHLPVRLTPEA
jgi:hypothetical protein